jgi:hypothetical protein
MVLLFLFVIFVFFVILHLIKMIDMANKQTDIVIANPMYDVVFKQLMMSGKDIAGYFIGTVLGEKIADIEFAPQEYAYTKQVQQEGSPKQTIGLIRLDFVATIRTKNGEHQKVLIEIQQSPKPTDLMRFRTYLGEQYKQQDNIIIKGDKIEKAIPIVIIYMLGFVFPDIATIAVKTNRTYIDIINGGKIENKNPFIESLTHDAYFIQIPRISREMYANWENISELMKMLSVFEQDYFIDKNFIKNYPYPTTDKNIKKMVDKLAYIAADPKVRRAMEEEYWAALNETLWKQTIAEQSNALAEQSNAIVQKDNTLAEQAKIIAEYQRRFGTLTGLNKYGNLKRNPYASQHPEIYG